MSVFPVGARVTGDAGAFVTAMASGQRSLNAFAGAAGLATAAIGALAGAAAIGAAIRATTEYRSELVKLNTLVGISREEIEAWDASIRGISQSTGQGASDVARAMFAITSGGARGTEALEILEQTAKASAIGLGDMTAIGRTTTAVMQAFGDTGLTASDAIDILVATVREGNLEASELAGAMSRILGPAKAVGASFQDVGAFMATFTRLGGDSNTAATGLLNTFNLLIKPPTEAREALERYGVSVERLRQVVADDGLQPALALLNDAIGDNLDALGEAIPNTRSLTAVLNTAGLQAQAYADVQKNVNESMGLTNEGFKTWGDTAEATFGRFNAAVEEVSLTIGETFLPPLTDMLETLQPIVLRLGEFITKVREIGASNDKRFEAWVGATFGNETTSRIERTTQAVDAFKERLKDMTDDQLVARQEELNNEIAHFTEIINTGNRGAAAASREIGALAAERRAIGELLAREADAQEEVNEATATGTIITQGMREAEAERLAQLAQITAALEEEVLALEEGERAVLAKVLADLNADDATRATTLALFDKVEALKAEAEAEREAAREKERARAEAERETDRLRKEADRAAERAQDAATRAAERLELAETQQRLKELGDVSKSMSEDVARAFTDIVNLTDSVEDAVADMVTNILRELQRLAIQKAITEPLANLLFGFFGGGGGGGGLSLSAEDVDLGVRAFGGDLAAAGISNTSGGAFSGEAPTIDVSSLTTAAVSLESAADRLSVPAPSAPVIVSAPDVTVEAQPAPDVTVQSPDVMVTAPAAPDVQVEPVLAPRITVQSPDVQPVLAPDITVQSPTVSAPDVTVQSPTVTVPPSPAPAVTVMAPDPTVVMAPAVIVPAPTVTVQAPAVEFPTTDLASQFAASIGSVAREIRPPEVQPNPFVDQSQLQRPGGPSTVVEQTLVFSPQFIDAADGDRWLRSKQGEIAQIVSDAARRSGDFANALRGRD